MTIIGNMASSIAKIGNGLIPGFFAPPQWKDQNFDPLANAVVSASGDPPVPFQLPGTLLFVANFPNTTATGITVSGVEINHDWKIGTNIFPHLHFVKLSAGSGNVKFGFTYRIMKNDNMIDGIVADFTAVDSVTQYVEEVPIELGEIDMSTIPEVGAQVVFTLYRIPGDPEDTFNGDVGVLSNGWHYQINSGGSRSRFAK